MCQARLKVDGSHFQHLLNIRKVILYATCMRTRKAVNVAVGQVRFSSELPVRLAPGTLPAHTHKDYRSMKLLSSSSLGIYRNIFFISQWRGAKA
jgi:hypothetical protein